MRILAIDSSAKAVSVSIVEDSKILGEVFLNCGLTHSVTIMPSVEWLLKTTGLKISDIDRIAIAAGPGSFTGLRIGIAAVKGLAWACDIPCCGVSTLEAAAHGAAHTGGTICAVMDARAQQVYNAIFTANDGRLTRVCDDRAITLSELSEELLKYNNVVLVGDGAELCYRAFEGKHAIAPEHIRTQRAAYVAALAQSVPVCSSQELKPEYIRLPQAERERLERLKKEGN